MKIEIEEFEDSFLVHDCGGKYKMMVCYMCREEFEEFIGQGLRMLAGLKTEGES